MSAGDLDAVRTLPLQAARTLARYERHVRKLVATWLDMELYRTVSEEIDAIGHLCGAVPELSVGATDLLISHAALIHALWHRGQHAGVPQDVDARLREHLAAIDAFARRCLRPDDLEEGTPRH